jgi:hypothetical protein
MPTCRFLLVDDSPAFLAATTALLDAFGWIEVVVRALIRPPNLSPIEIEPRSANRNPGEGPMILPRANSRSDREQRAQSARPPDAPRQVSELLVELVKCLGRIVDGPPGTDEGSPEWWDGGDYAYVEVDIPSVTGLDIDINVHRGRAYIRMER